MPGLLPPITAGFQNPPSEGGVRISTLQMRRAKPRELKEFVQSCTASWERQDRLWGLPGPFALPWANPVKEALDSEAKLGGPKTATGPELSLPTVT